MALCPHCSQTVELLPSRSSSPSNVQRQAVGTVKKEVMYACPHCKRVLGFAYFFGGLITKRP